VRAATLDGHVGISGFGGYLFSHTEDAHGVIGQLGRLLRAAARHLRDFRQGFIDFANCRLGAAAGTGYQPGCHALFVFKQRLGQVLGSHLLVIHADRDRLRGLQKALGAVSKFFQIHKSVPVSLSGPI